MCLTQEACLLSIGKNGNKSVHGRVLIFYDSWNHLDQCDELSDYVIRLKAELADLARYPKNKLKRYSPCFTLTRHDQDIGFDYAVDTDKVDKMRERKRASCSFRLTWKPPCQICLTITVLRQSVWLPGRIIFDGLDDAIKQEFAWIRCQPAFSYPVILFGQVLADQSQR